MPRITGPVARLWGYLAVLSLALILATGASVYVSPREVDQNHYRLAGETARAFFSGLVTTRRWNAMHGGVYVPVTNSVRPNPYLEDPLRDLTTREVILLTKINPAHQRPLWPSGRRKGLTRARTTPPTAQATIGPHSQVGRRRVRASGASHGPTLGVGDRLRTRVEGSEFSVSERVSISMGTTEYRSPESIESLMSRADKALYRAKEHRRNRVETLVA